MNEIESLDPNEIFGRKSLNDVVMNVKNLQAQAGEKFIKIGAELFYAKDNGFLNEAIEKLDMEKSFAYKFIKAYKRFGALHHSLPDTKLTELVTFPEEIPAERLIEMGETMTRQELREKKSFLKGASTNKPKTPNINNFIKQAEKKGFTPHQLKKIANELNMMAEALLKEELK
jgi:hypothetical protein